MAAEGQEGGGTRARQPGLRFRRVSVPLVLQMEAAECGAACLAMILAYHGREVALEELREQCGVSRDGSKAVNLARAAQHYGLDCRPVKTEPAALIEQLPLPAIVFWEFNHFLVVEGYGGGRVQVCDPSYGHRTLTWEEFDRGFTGVALTFTPGEKFTRGGPRRGAWGGLMRRLRPVRWPLMFALLASLLLLAPGLAVPALVGIYVNRILVEGYAHLLGPLLLWMAGALAARTALVWAQQYYLLRMRAKLAAVDSCRFLWRMLRLPICFFARRYPAEVSQRSQYNDRLAQLLSGQLPAAALNLLTLAVYFPVLWLYDPWLALIAGVAALATVGMARFFAVRRRELNLRLMQQRARLGAATTGALQVIETIKGCALEEQTFREFAGLHAQAARGEQALGRMQQRMAAVPEAVLVFARAACLIVGAVRIMDGALTVGELTAFLLLLEFFLAPLLQLAAFGGAVQDAAACIRRVDDVLDAPADPAFAPAPAASGESAAAGAAADHLMRLPLGKLEFRGVCFGYSPLDPPLIADLSFVLEPGRRLALVGPSGCGKSTVTRLAAGLLRPWSGQILLDGRPREEWAAADLHAAVALVDQDIFLFEATVRDNLTLWDRAVREEPLVRACRDACLHEDLAQRPGGYSAHVEENGANFSGGQRARLELARALCGNPRLLILDEATSALDPLMEQRIGENLRERGCACLFAAHRLSTVREADEILFLDRGQAIERGTHEELLSLNGRYAALMREDAIAMSASAATGAPALLERGQT